MNIRAKFRVDEVTDYGGNTKRVKLSAKYDDSIPEDQRFHEATPTGSFEMTVTNPAALAELVPGRAFYLELIPVPAG